MDDIVILDGETYISSKRASILSGYARDYISFLARKSEILARQIGGHWYILENSIRGYLQKIAEYKPKAPSPQSRISDPDSVISLDGKEFVSVKKGADLTGYHQDYVGQLCREGKILSRQIGNRWYIERGALLGHKKAKAALLAAVQAEAVGLRRTAPSDSRELDNRDAEPLMTYSRDDGDLTPNVLAENEAEPYVSRVTDVPISVHISDIRERREPIARPRRVLSANGVLPWYRISLPTMATLMATIVLVIAVGYVSLRRDALYAHAPVEGSGYALLVKADKALDQLLDFVEAVVAADLRFERQN